MNAPFAMPAPQQPDYIEFLRAKIAVAPSCGAGAMVDGFELHPILKPHQAAMVRWALAGGRRAIFARFGLGKSVMQLELCRVLGLVLGLGRALIVCPLGVRQEFARDAKMLGIETRFARTSAEVLAAPDFAGVWLTNYESVRDGKMDPALFAVACLDEASCLRGFGGSKTFREFMRLFDGIPFKFVATATPSPNDYIELLAYAAFLEVMDVGQAKTRFFKRDSTKADKLTLHAHKEAEFWHWVNSWAAFVQKPSDLGFDDEGYDLPPIVVNWHEVPSDHKLAGADKSGQGRLLKADAIGVVDASREKRDSLGARIAKMLELREEDPGAHRLLWHDLESERAAIEAAIPGVTSIYGAQDIDLRENKVIAFSEGRVPELAAKPVLAGSGCNFQRHCWWEIFLGIGFKFNDFIQAIYRVQRYGQTHEVRIDLIYSEAERAVRQILEEKWRRHDEQAARMSEIIREHGLGLTGAGDALVRSIDDGSAEVIERGYAAGESSEAGHHWQWRVANRDTVIETRAMPAESVGLIVTSIPFSTQYEYTPSYNDFGHTDDNAHFFRQMDYLTPELLRVLKPGRVAAIHVKDRIRPGGMDGLGFQTVDPFHSQCIDHYRAHGFAYLGMHTIVTDVVRENGQTYRLGWSEQCKDGTRQGCGMPEYVLLFRKPQTDRSRGYADEPVVKAKPLCWTENGEQVAWDDDLSLVTGSGYSRARWQIDAAALWRSSGERLLSIEDLTGIAHDAIYRMFRGHNWATEYDYEAHVLLTEQMEARHALPTDFALMPATSWHPEVWTDVARMRTLNGVQHAKGREMHLCPLQFDIVDRLIRQRSAPGDLVYDPFGGLMTVPLRAVKFGRRGAAAELNPGYFADGVRHLREQDQGRATASFFDMLEQADAAE